MDAIYDNMSYLDFRPHIRRRSSRRHKSKVFYNITSPAPANEKYYIGLHFIGTTNNVLPDNYQKCKVHFLKTEQHALEMIIDDDTVVVNVTTDITFLRRVVVSKVFAIKVESTDNKIYFKFYLVTDILININAINASIAKDVLCLLLSITPPESVSDKKTLKSCAQDVQQLYLSVQKLQGQNIVALQRFSVQYDRLKPKLRPYQENAVKWMLMREQHREVIESLHPLFQEVTLESGATIYFNKYSGHVQTDAPHVQTHSTGGILADEMGLGKTVEVLALILSHQKEAPDLNNLNLSKAPVVKKLRKLQPRCLPENEPAPLEDISQVGKKGATRAALMKWYDLMLEDVVPRKRAKIEKRHMQCICGSEDEEDQVQCNECEKIQHSRCLNYKRSYGRYLCPQCWKNQPLLESAATLIVCPKTLHQQWLDEICKHVQGPLKILDYEGSSTEPIYPAALKNYDVVLTTYNVLQADLRLTHNVDDRNLRNTPKYAQRGSPITTVKWWRLCLDEVQTVETGIMVREMANKIVAEYRWGITGTPISKDISDIYPLIEYLQLNPYSEPDTWNHLLYNPYLLGNPEPLHEFLSQVLWRSAKDDVIDQIGIPKQTVMEYLIEFSAVEKYYYRREHEMSRNDFLVRLSKFDLDAAVSSLDRSDLKNVLRPLLSLRHACIHPNAVKGRYLAAKKVGSMQELLDALISKNKTEAEECLRLIIAALNGMAGLHLLSQNPAQAVHEYRKVLQLSQKFNQLSIDKLQLIHTMYNLGEVLAMKPSVPATLRDDTILEDCAELERQHINRYICQTQAALKGFEEYADSARKLQENFQLMDGQWFTDLLSWITLNDLVDELITKIRILEDQFNVETKYQSLTDFRIRHLVSKWYSDIYDYRNKTITGITNLYLLENDKLVISQKMVQIATDCHLRPQKKNKKKSCPICVSNEDLQLYESKLFSTAKREDEKSNKGSWKPTAEELYLRGLYNFAKSNKADIKCIQDGKTCLAMIEAFKKEFKEVRRLWTYIDQQVCAQDELDMCKIRLQIKAPNSENKSKPTRTDMILKQLTYVQENHLENIHMIDEHELDYQRAILQGEEKANMEKLEKSLGTFSYLETLRKQQYDGAEPEPCPICKCKLTEHWSILPCGHCYCLECIDTLLINVIQGSFISCPICRKREKITDISYIKFQEKGGDENEIKVKGNCSTKIEAIIRLVLKLRNEQEDVKILIFSTWPAILKLIKAALEENSVETICAFSNCMDRTLSKFKEGKTVLLLPVSLGGKGLNLTEATHVIMVEQFLNPADELQVIGRIHRIGQTKPTFVHKFIVKNTIEEKIHRAISLDAKSWHKNKLKLKQLRDLFIEEKDENNQNDLTEGYSLENGSIDSSVSQEFEDDQNDLTEEGSSMEDSRIDFNFLDESEQSSIVEDSF